MKRSVWIAVAIAVLACARLGADTVYLEGGRILKGKVTFEGDLVKIVTAMGTAVVPRDKIIKIEKTVEPDVPKEKTKTAAEIYKEKAAAVKPDDAEAHYELAVWCRGKYLNRQCREHLDKVVAIDPDHEKARAELNQVKVDGKWVEPMPGMVYVAGDWATPMDAVARGAQLYKLRKYEDATKIYERAVRLIHSRETLSENRLCLGKCYERLGRWDDAQKTYQLIERTHPAVKEKDMAKLRREIIAKSTGGMYLVKEPVAAEDIFSIDTDDKEKAKTLVGLQSLKDPFVMQIALRERCKVFIDNGKGLLEKAKNTTTGGTKGDKKAWKLIDEAEEEFNKAEGIIEDIARGHLIESVKQRIAIVDRRFEIMDAHLTGQIARINMMWSHADQRNAANKLVGDVDDMLRYVVVMGKLANRYPDDLAEQLAHCKAIHDALQQFKVQLSAFIGE